MKNEFVPYGLAVKLKEKGFNEPCFMVYHEKKFVAITSHQESNFPIPTTTNKALGSKTFTAPLYQQVVEWLRIKHKIYVWAQLKGNSFKQKYTPCVMENLNPNKTSEYYTDSETPTEALVSAIEVALKLIPA